ncbi:thioesterase family protein [Telmatospirillum sp.]|uniref:thioesterase family protein n=1 Tax=Telmatospirillum sp. TaxID=2079197 RepID=UPI0028505C04|nr:thioesterase family protein [Telmatospirillum sp.]MDR3436139.1 thioesterase family protein [Telmatospirillum sp.]
MTQLIRLLWVIIVSLFRGRLGAFDESLLAFRVMPADIDINLHMNNARYLAMMDLGRWDFILRSGFWRRVLKARLQPVIGGAVVRYRRPLKPFQPFVLKTRLITWDERWLYLEQDIESRGVLACSSQVRAAFVGPAGLVAPADVAALIGVKQGPPPAPAWIQNWRDFDIGLEKQPPLPAAGEMSCAH